MSIIMGSDTITIKNQSGAVTFSIDNKSAGGSMNALVIDKDNIKRDDADGNEYKIISEKDVTDTISLTDTSDDAKMPIVEAIKKFLQNDLDALANDAISKMKTNMLEYIARSAYDGYSRVWYIPYTMRNTPTAVVSSDESWYMTGGPFRLHKRITATTNATTLATNAAGTSFTTADIAVNEPAWTAEPLKNYWLWMNYINASADNDLSVGYFDVVAEVTNFNDFHGPFYAGRVRDNRVAFMCRDSSNSYYYEVIFLRDANGKGSFARYTSANGTADCTEMMRARNLTPVSFNYDSKNEVFTSPTTFMSGSANQYTAQMQPIKLCFIYTPHAPAGEVNIDGIENFESWFKILHPTYMLPYGFDLRYCTAYVDCQYCFWYIESTILRNIAFTNDYAVEWLTYDYSSQVGPFELSPLKTIDPPMLPKNGQDLFRGHRFLSLEYIYKTWRMNEISTYGWRSVHSLMANCQSAASWLDHPTGHSTALDFSHFNLKYCQSLTYIFHQCCYYRGKIILWKSIPCTTNLGYLFWQDFMIDGVDGMYSWETNRVLLIEHAFHQCYNLLYLDITNWNFASVQVFDMFMAGCYSCERLYIKKDQLSSTTVGGNLGFMNEYGATITPYIDGSSIPFTIKNIKFGEWDDDHELFTYDANGSVAEVFLNASDENDTYSWNKIDSLTGNKGYQREYRYVIKPIWHAWDPVAAADIHWE